MDQESLKSNAPKLPPPVPAGLAGQNATSFARRAGILSICIAFVAFIPAVIFLVALASPANGSLPLSKIILVVAAGLLMAGGLILGILGLLKGADRDQKAVGPVWTGLILNGALILILVGVGPELLKAKEKARTRKQYTEIQDSFQKLRKESKEMLSSGTNIDISTDRLGEVQKKLDNATNVFKGEEALVVKATSAYMLRGQNFLKAYSTAAKAISEPSAVDMSGVTNKAELAVRRLAVQHFLEANQKLMAFYEEDENTRREELARFKISQRKIESLMEGYQKSKPMRQIVVKIRQTDVQLGNSMVAMLDLLENNWGRWKYDRESQMVVFEDDRVVEKYNVHFEEMNAAAELQKKLQAQAAKKL